VPSSSSSSSRAGTPARVTACLTVGTALLWPLASTADAHVRVRADETATGAYSALTFRVPNESDTASTTEVSVQLPQDTPFSSVQTRPVSGWRAELVTEKLPSPVQVNGATLTEAVRTVTWTADRGAAIAPEQFQEFALSVGPLPAAGTVLLPATQTYSDGEVVRWDEPVPESGEEPERPAPVLVVTTAASSTTASEPAPASPAPAPTTDAGPAATDGTARWLGGLALALAVLATALGAVAVRTARGSR
jgi:uncharacterized protein YcnI